MTEAVIIVLASALIINCIVIHYQSKKIVRLLAKLTEEDSHIGEPAPYIPQHPESWRNNVL